MQVRVSKLGVATYVTPEGPLVGEHLARLVEALREVRESGGAKLVVDLRHTAYCDSAGLEFLLDLATELRDEGGSLRLVNPNPLCREVLAITRLDETIPIHEDLESAGRSFL
ncbi:MAG: STAS domain-containing protein [Candidatus Eisenbacteria sp.]|nr:STAS domain-containing protein [Candidatus Eisenbacteria bacterium]